MKNGKESLKETKNIKNFTHSFQYDIDLNNIENVDIKIKGKIINQFSDTIVISYPLTDSVGIKEILIDISNYLLTALLFNHLFRGAVVYDKLYHKDTNIFGPAVLKAYEMERNMAIFPRIILDTNIIDMYSEKQGIKDLTTWRIDDVVTRDFDGQYFLDYIPSILPEEEDEDVIVKVKALFRKNLNGLIEEMEKSNNFSVKTKYLWLKEKYFGYLNAVERDRR